MWYISPSKSISGILFKHLRFALGTHRHTYEIFLLAGYFNTEEAQPCVPEFLTNYSSQNLVKDKTCLKNPENPRFLDRFTIKNSSSYQNTTAVVNCLLDVHKMAVIVC